MAPSRLAPFLQRDFTLLYWTNIFEFFAQTLSRLSALQWLYEATHDARAMGMLGVVTLVCQLPSIALGGVLADALPRAPLVANVQAAATLVALLRWLLCATGGLTPAVIYLTVGLLEITKYLEGSARSVILPQVVDASALPHAVSLVMITQYAGEILAPFVFWALADAGGALTLSFLAAAVSFGVCAVLPRLIRADTTPVADRCRGSRGAAEAAEMLPGADAAGSGASGGGGDTAAARAAAALVWTSRAWSKALISMVEGVRYIFSHPLLPGLYALDWGFTCASGSHCL